MSIPAHLAPRIHQILYVLASFLPRLTTRPCLACSALLKLWLRFRVMSATNESAVMLDSPHCLQAESLEGEENR